LIYERSVVVRSGAQRLTAYPGGGLCFA
jgi:hypothetical protein